MAVRNLIAANIYTGSEDPEIVFGRLPSSQLTLNQGIDFWEASSETGRYGRLFVFRERRKME
jgi:hypothetical protein